MKIIRCAVILAIAVAIVGPHLAEAANDEPICSFGSWALYRPGRHQVAVEIDDTSRDLCTHTIYVFVRVDQSGYVQILDAWNEDDGRVVTNLVDLRAENPSLKAMLAIGSNVLSDVASGPPSLRGTFVNSVISFLGQHHFDGLALHNPGGSGGAPSFNIASIQLLKALKQKLDKKGYTLTTTTITGQSTMSKYTCVTAGYSSDPTDCQKFYFCIPRLDGSFLPVPFACASGLLFDKTKGMCNFAGNVTC